MKRLVRGGTVLTLDPELGDFERADVLVEDTWQAQLRSIACDWPARRHVRRRLLGVDRERLRRLADESRDYLFERAREVEATGAAAVGGGWMPPHF